MFRECINSTALIGSDADYLFHITGDAFYSDVTFVSTLRAMLGRRMKDDQSLHFTVKNRSIGETEFKERSDHDIVDDFLCSTFPDRITLYNLTSAMATNDRVFDALEKELPETGAWERVKKVTLYYKGKEDGKGFRVFAFINRDIKSTLLVTERLNLQKFHVLQGAITVLVPWYFEGENKPSKDDKLLYALFQALAEKTSDKYLEAIENIAKTYDIRGAKIQRLLGDFETKRIGAQIDSLQRDIRNRNDIISSKLNEIRQLQEQLETMNATLLGFKTMQRTGAEAELAKFFASNPDLDLLDVGRNTIDFVVRGFIDSPSPGSEDVIDDLDTYLYDDTNGYDVDDLRDLLYKIFITQEIKLRVCSRITLQIPGGIIKDRSYHYDFSAPQYRTYMPHVHHDDYTCFGDHGYEVSELIGEGKYIEAISQCIEAVHSFDLCDPTVGETFIHRFVGLNDRGNIRCLELPTGGIVTPGEAMEWMKERR